MAGLDEGTFKQVLIISKMPKKIFIILFVILFLSGCTSRLTTDVRIDEEGKILVEEKIDQPTISKIENLEKRTYLAYQGFTKKDWGIVIFYELRLNINSLSAFDEDVANLSFSFTVPGKLKETNADKIEGEKLIWTTFKEDEIFARSQEIRWWLVSGLGAVIFLYLLSFVFKKR